MRGDEPGVRGMLHGAHDGVSQVWKADELVRDGEGEGCGRCEGLLYLESVVGEQGRESCYSGNLESFHMFGFRVLVFFFFFSRSVCRSIWNRRGQSTKEPGSIRLSYNV